MLGGVNLNYKLLPENFLKLVYFFRDNLANFFVSDVLCLNNSLKSAESEHPQFKIFYSYDNQIEICSEEKIISLQPESVFFENWHIPSKCITEEFRIFVFCYGIKPEFSINSPLYQTFCEILSTVAGISIPCDDSATKIITDMVKNFHIHTREYELSIFCDIIRVLIGAYQKITSLQDTCVNYINVKNRKIVQEIADFLTNHSEIDDKLEDIARLYGLNHDYMNRLFKSIYGVPIQKYKCMLKIEKAKDLLIESNKTVAEIASLLYFSTDQHFSHVFKREIGISPYEFRKTHRDIVN